LETIRKKGKKSRLVQGHPENYLADRNAIILEDFNISFSPNSSRIYVLLKCTESIFQDRAYANTRKVLTILRFKSYQLFFLIKMK
jgi:hypothetical protein